MFADLHIHTSHSDGLLDVRSVILDAKARGVKVIAITDHDTVSGCVEKIEEDGEIKIIHGVEITVSSKLHILGYFIDCDNKHLKECLESMALKKARWMTRLIQYVSKEGGMEFRDFFMKQKEITIKSVNEWLNDINQGIYSKSEINARYFWNGESRYGKYPTFRSKEAIDLIRGAGGIAVLAHPALLWENNEKFENQLHTLMEEGLNGLEVYHLLNERAGLEKYFEKLAKKNRLMMSGGSDFHGSKNKYTKIGEYGLSEKGWEEFAKMREEGHII